MKKSFSLMLFTLVMTSLIAQGVDWNITGARSRATCNGNGRSLYRRGR
jgi:hypothetical protein